FSPTLTPHAPPPCPYTTLFRSRAVNLIDDDSATKWLSFARTATITLELTEPAVVTNYVMTSANDFAGRDPATWTLRGSTDGETRSEEHTSELQSRFDLVCRLLL